MADIFATSKVEKQPMASTVLMNEHYLSHFAVVVQYHEYQFTKLLNQKPLLPAESRFLIISSSDYF